MAYTRDFFPKLNFVLTRATGSLEDRTLFIHLMSFRAEAGDYEAIRELVDARDLHNADGLTVRGLIRTAEMHKALFPEKNFLVAVLVDSVEFKIAVDIYASLAHTENLKVKAFDGKLDEPLEWLGYDPDARVKIKHFMDRRMAPMQRPRTLSVGL